MCITEDETESTHRPCWNHICDNFNPSMLCYMTQGMSRHSVTLNTTNMFLYKFCLILGFTMISSLIPCRYLLLLLLLLLFIVLVIISLMVFFFQMVWNLAWIVRNPVSANPRFNFKRSNSYFLLVKYFSLLMGLKMNIKLKTERQTT